MFSLLLRVLLSGLHSNFLGLRIMNDLFNLVFIYEAIDKMRKERNMTTEEYAKKYMGYFAGWSFGVPVRIFSAAGTYLADARLIHEDSTRFWVLYASGEVALVNKKLWYYELIPYTYNNFTRYPVCQSLKEVSYCNALDETFRFFDCELGEIIPALEPIATLILNGKEIQLSAETAARLKKELGVE